MRSFDVVEKARAEGWSDEQVVAQVLAGETALYEILMRRYNQRVYRAVRAILRDDSEAEDVMQDAYVRAYRHLAQFEGRASFSTWLTRIAVNEALARVRRRGRSEPLDEYFEGGEPAANPQINLDPEQNVSNAELSQLLEEAILALPEQYRAVLMLRDIEEMSTAETAAALDVSEENVKVRLHRGHALLRKGLISRIGPSAKDAFSFMSARCDRVVRGVFERLAESPANPALLQ